MVSNNQERVLSEPNNDNEQIQPEPNYNNEQNKSESNYKSDDLTKFIFGPQHILYMCTNI